MQMVNRAFVFILISLVEWKYYIYHYITVPHFWGESLFYVTVMMDSD